MTDIGELPEEWDVQTFENIAAFKLGRTPARQESTYWRNGIYPWVSISDLKPFGQVKITREMVSKAAYDVIFKGKLVSKGTLLMSFKLTLGRTSILNVDAFHNEAIISIYPSSRVMKEFLFYYLPIIEFSNYYDRVVKGKTLNKAKIAKLLIPLPPLSEQKKIAAVLSAVQEAKEKTEAVIKATMELKKSLMKHLFTYGPVPVEDAENVKRRDTEIGQIPEHWEVVNLEQLAKKEKHSIVDGPFGSSIKKVDYLASGVPIIRIKNISKHGRFINQDFLYISLEKYESLKRSAVYKDDILVSRVGTIGNVCIYPGIYEKVLLSTTGVCKVSLDSSIASIQFIYSFMNSDIYRNQLLAGASASVQKYISLSTLKGSKVPLPPVDEQSDIALTLVSVDDKLDAEQSKLNALDALFKTLLQNLMTGKVRVNDLELPL